MRFFFIVLLAAVLSGYGDELAFAKFRKSRMTIEQIRVVSSEKEIEKGSKSSRSIEIDFPCDRGKLKEALAPFLGKKISETVLLEIKDTVKHVLAQEPGLGFSVSIPEQTLRPKPEGPLTVAILVSPPTLQGVQVVDNHWLSKNTVLNVMKLSEGESFYPCELLDNAAWLNTNPFIHTSAIARPGRPYGNMDIDLMVNDRFPVRVYAGTDNTGNSFTGNNRLFTGMNASLGIYFLLSYQFTSSFDFPELLSHYGSFTWFLPWKNELQFYGGYARIHPKLDGFDSRGSDMQLSMRYKIPFKPLYTTLFQQFKWGADFKKTDSSLFFLGAIPGSLRIPVNQRQADLFQFYLGYKMSKDRGDSDLMFALDLLFSPFIFLPHQTSADYNALRPNADIRYVYGKLALAGRYPVSKGKFVGFLRGQGASGPLLPSEQYGLGGYDTVRGYQERVYLADNAAIANLELHSPSFSFTSRSSKIDELYLLLFVDAAYGYNWDATSAFPKDAWLLGVGPGLRYQIAPYLTARFDYGFRVHNTSFGNGQIGRFHFSVIAGY